MIISIPPVVAPVLNTRPSATAISAPPATDARNRSSVTAPTLFSRFVKADMAKVA